MVRQGKYCWFCGKLISGRRRGSRYCNDAHKQKFHRGAQALIRKKFEQSLKSVARELADRVAQAEAKGA